MLRVFVYYLLWTEFTWLCSVWLHFLFMRSHPNVPFYLQMTVAGCMNAYVSSAFQIGEMSLERPHFRCLAAMCAVGVIGGGCGAAIDAIWNFVQLPLLSVAMFLGALGGAAYAVMSVAFFALLGRAGKHCS